MAHQETENLSDESTDRSRSSLNESKSSTHTDTDNDYSDGDSDLNNVTIEKDGDNIGLVTWLKSMVGRKSDESLRQAIEDYIEETTDSDSTSLAFHEKTLISNVLKLRDLSTSDVMIPRADIVAFDLNQPINEFLSLMADKPHSRVPVYKASADDILGTIHIKDVLKELATMQRSELQLEPLIRDVPIVSPAMPILDLLLQMRETRKHMVLVVDEFGGIDGLVTIGDLIEGIVGEFYDEHDQDVTPKFSIKSDGSIMADARVSIRDFEEKICPVLENDDERDDVDTLGGLVFSISGRIPARGEVLKHPASGLVFEIVDADPRRVKKMRIQNVPKR